MDEVLDFVETIVIGNGADEFKQVPGRLKEDQQLVDLVRISQQQSGRQYDGICW